MWTPITAEQHPSSTHPTVVGASSCFCCGLQAQSRFRLVAGLLGAPCAPPNYITPQRLLEQASGCVHTLHSGHPCTGWAAFVAGRASVDCPHLGFGGQGFLFMGQPCRGQSCLRRRAPPSQCQLAPQRARCWGYPLNNSVETLAADARDAGTASSVSTL